MVDGIDEEIVDVQQQVAIGLFQHRIDEVGFRHRLVGGRVVGDVLHRDAPTQRILRLADARGDMVHGFLGEGDRHQVVQMSVVGAVAQVLAVQDDVVLVEEAARAGEEGVVQRGYAAERQRQSVAGQRVLR